MTARTYEPWPEKHKWPQGFGSLCPRSLRTEDAQALLEQAVEAPGEGEALYAVSGQWVFVARPTRREEGIWHGYPVPGAEAGEQVLVRLEREGLITRHERRRLRKQKNLPPEWPS